MTPYRNRAWTSMKSSPCVACSRLSPPGNVSLTDGNASSEAAWHGMTRKLAPGRDVLVRHVVYEAAGGKGEKRTSSAENIGKNAVSELLQVSAYVSLIAHQTFSSLV